MSEVPPSYAAAPQPTPSAAAPGAVSPDGQFLWDGTQWKPITGHSWEPTDWTRPMQLAVGAYFILGGLFSAITPIFFADTLKATAKKSIQQSNSNLTPTQIDQALQIGLAVGFGAAIFFGIVYIVLGVLSLLRRWTWLFYVDVVILGLGTLGIFGNLSSLGRGASALTTVGLVSSVLAGALFLWALAARVRRGVWACRKVPVTV